ncbi:MAG: ShlB/FhaC/HecB family hemolysin secretion/activation protein [Bdellovibrionales bacterium]
MKKLHTTALVATIAFFATNAAYGQTLNAGDISRELEKTLPSLKSGEIGKSAEPSKTVSPKESEQKENKPIADPTKNLPSKETLGSPIVEIYLFSPVLKTEILNLLRHRMFGHKAITTEDLVYVRQKVWDMGIKNKKLLHVDFKVVPNPRESQYSWLIVNVINIAVRNVKIESDGTIRQSLLDSIQREMSRDYKRGKSLDLNDLDNKIKTRLRLGDVLLRTAIIPVDEKHVDLKVSVKSTQKTPNSGLLQLDNDGGWSFGRDRIIGGASLRGALPGDEINLMMMKTADLGNFDYGNGMYFIRAEYQFPIGELGVRSDTWASGLHYHEVRAAGGNQTNGEALEFGQGVIKPMYTDKTTMIDVRADFVMKYTVDRVLEDVRTSEKAAYLGRIRTILSQTLGNSQWLQATLDLTQGTIDLSGNKQAFTQDQAGPRVNGLFTKAEINGAWQGIVGEDDRTDFRLGFKGQWAIKNLDSMEKFSLGGSTGLRAFGSGEASGDVGFMVNGDLGYTFKNGIRPFVLYDVGMIRENISSWTGSNTKDYALQDLGVGVSKKFDPVNLSFTFAHQVGPNPGLSAQGLDVDNSKQHYRIWASVSYRY